MAGTSTLARYSPSCGFVIITSICRDVVMGVITRQYVVTVIISDPKLIVFCGSTLNPTKSRLEGALPGPVNRTCSGCVISSGEALMYEQKLSGKFGNTYCRSIYLPGCFSESGETPGEGAPCLSNRYPSCEATIPYCP